MDEDVADSEEDLQAAPAGGSGAESDSDVQMHRDARGSGTEIGNRGADSDEEELFDITLAASHSYMGSGLVSVRGRSVLEAGWRGRVPALAQNSVVFPGETVPMLLVDQEDTIMIHQAIRSDKLFGLLCPDESGHRVSGYGVVCEVYEAALGEEHELAAPLPPIPPRLPRAVEPLTFKARATHRFRLVEEDARACSRPMPLYHYARMRMVEVEVLGETAGAAPLRLARLASLDPHRRDAHAHPHPLHESGCSVCSGVQQRLRVLDAALTPWPRFLYEIFEFRRMRQRIHEYFNTIMLGDDKLPTDAVSLSFWVASNLSLSPRDRLALFLVDNALLRLHMELRFISRIQNSVLCCSTCTEEVARREHAFAMSSDGVHSNYTNLGGYLHDIVTVCSVREEAVSLSGAPSAEYSWFPGYAWTIAQCVSCRAHLGWRFDAIKRTLRPQRFYGLCRNNVQPAPDADADISPTSPTSLSS